MQDAKPSLYDGTKYVCACVWERGWVSEWVVSERERETDLSLNSPSCIFRTATDTNHWPFFSAVLRRLERQNFKTLILSSACQETVTQTVTTAAETVNTWFNYTSGVPARLDASIIFFLFYRSGIIHLKAQLSVNSFYMCTLTVSCIFVWRHTGPKISWL